MIPRQPLGIVSDTHFGWRSYAYVWWQFRQCNLEDERLAAHTVSSHTTYLRNALIVADGGVFAAPT